MARYGYTPPEAINARKEAQGRQMTLVGAVLVGSRRHWHHPFDHPQSRVAWHSRRSHRRAVLARAACRRRRVLVGLHHHPRRPRQPALNE